MEMKNGLKHYVALLVMGFVVMGVVLVFNYPQEDSLTSHHYNEIHIHADFAIFIDGERLDFSNEGYQSDETVARHRFLHLHGGDGGVLHIHAKDQSFADFIESIGMRLSPTCFILHGGMDRYCHTSDETTYRPPTQRKGELRMFVNGVERFESFDTYIPQDLDQIFITNETVPNKIVEQMQQVSDRACIQSGICPERGEALESCSTVDGCAAPPRIEPIHTH